MSLILNSIFWKCCELQKMFYKNFTSSLIFNRTFMRLTGTAYLKAPIFSVTLLHTLLYSKNIFHIAPKNKLQLLKPNFSSKHVLRLCFLLFFFFTRESQFCSPSVFFLQTIRLTGMTHSHLTLLWLHPWSKLGV